MPQYGRIQRNTTSALGSNPARIDRGLADFQRRPHKLAHYGSNTALTAPLPALVDGELVFPGSVMDGAEYRIPYTDIGRTRSITSAIGQKGVFRARCLAVDCRSSDTLAIRAIFKNPLADGIVDEYNQSVFFDDDCDALVNTCALRIPRLVSAVNSSQTRVQLSLITGVAAESGNFYLGITTDQPYLVEFFLEGFGPIETLTPFIARDLFATQLGSWNRVGLGAGNPDNPIRGFEMEYRYFVEQDANEGGSSNPYSYGQSLLTQKDTLVVTFDVTNTRALAAFTEMSTILLGTKTPAAIYNRRITTV